MSEKTYVIPVLLTVPAESYAKAVQEAQSIVEGLNTDASIGMVVESYFEHDNIGQRVLYLHPEEDPDYEHTKEEDDDNDD